MTNINISNNYIVCQYKKDLTDTDPRETKNEGSHFKKSFSQVPGYSEKHCLIKTNIN